MTISHSQIRCSIDRIVATEVLPALLRRQRLPLTISCLGAASYGGTEPADSFDRVVPLGECRSPEEAMQSAVQQIRGGISPERENHLQFSARIVFIQDAEQALVLAGKIRAGIILWQHPVASDTGARQIVAEASRLRGQAFAAQDPGEARKLRFRAAVLEARLVDAAWRETATELLRLPKAA